MRRKRRKRERGRRRAGRSGESGSGSVSRCRARFRLTRVVFPGRLETEPPDDRRLRVEDDAPPRERRSDRRLGERRRGDGPKRLERRVDGRAVSSRRLRRERGGGEPRGRRLGRARREPLQSVQGRALRLQRERERNGRVRRRRRQRLRQRRRRGAERGAARRERAQVRGGERRVQVGNTRAMLLLLRMSLRGRSRREGRERGDARGAVPARPPKRRRRPDRLALVAGGHPRGGAAIAISSRVANRGDDLAEEERSRRGRERPRERRRARRRRGRRLGLGLGLGLGGGPFFSLGRFFSSGLLFASGLLRAFRPLALGGSRGGERGERVRVERAVVAREVRGGRRTRGRWVRARLARAVVIVGLRRTPREPRDGDGEREVPEVLPHERRRVLRLPREHEKHRRQRVPALRQQRVRVLQRRVLILRQRKIAREKVRQLRVPRGATQATQDADAPEAHEQKRARRVPGGVPRRRELGARGGVRERPQSGVGAEPERRHRVPHRRPPRAARRTRRKSRGARARARARAAETETGRREKSLLRVALKRPRERLRVHRGASPRDVGRPLAGLPRGVPPEPPPIARRAEAPKRREVPTRGVGRRALPPPPLGGTHLLRERRVRVRVPQRVQRAEKAHAVRGGQPGEARARGTAESLRARASLVRREARGRVIRRRVLRNGPPRRRRRRWRRRAPRGDVEVLPEHEPRGGARGDGARGGE